MLKVSTNKTTQPAIRPGASTPRSHQRSFPGLHGERTGHLLHTARVVHLTYFGMEGLRVSLQTLFHSFLSFLLVIQVIITVLTVTVRTELPVGKTVAISAKKDGVM